MGFFDAILKILFGGGNPKPVPPVHRSDTLPPKPAPAPSPLPAPPPIVQPAPAPNVETPIGVAPSSPPLAPPVAPSATTYLANLVAADKTPLGAADYAAAAKRLGCEVAALRAVVEVECGPLGGFDKKGRPTILYEPHWFSQLTTPKRKYDQSNPTVSYKSWGTLPYPRNPDGNWARLEEAFALDPDAALQSVSWGRFQIMGLNYRLCGYATVRDFLAAMIVSEKLQLDAFEKFVRAKQIDDDLRLLDWAGFAHGYNGPLYEKNKYDTKLATAYAAWKAKGVNV